MFCSTLTHTFCRVYVLGCTRRYYNDNNSSSTPKRLVYQLPPRIQVFMRRAAQANRQRGWLIPLFVAFNSEHTFLLRWYQTRVNSRRDASINSITSTHKYVWTGLWDGLAKRKVLSQIWDAIGLVVGWFVTY